MIRLRERRPAVTTTEKAGLEARFGTRQAKPAPVRAI